jgi:ubiquitin C-terminal hydrolase
MAFHFKRFKQKGYLTDKNDKLIDFPLTGLDLSEYYRGVGTDHAIYDCYAVSNHFGSLSFGHYTAFGKNKATGQWYDFDDSRVS